MQNAAGLVAEYRHGWGLRILNILTALFGLPGLMFLSDDAAELPIELRLVGVLCLTGVPLLTAGFVWCRGFLYRLRVYETRIECRSVFGTRTVSLGPQTKFRHRNVQQIVNGVKAGRHTYLTFQDERATIKANTNVVGVEELQALAFELEAGLVLPEAMRKHEAGGRLVFGPLVVQHDTLSLRRKSTSLKGLEIKLEEGSLYFCRGGRELHLLGVDTGDVDNLETFLQVAQSAGATLQSKR